VIIKYPRSRSPLLYVCSLISQLEREVANENKTALLYMSSLLFSNHVSCDNGRDILSWISELASRHRERFICVARATAPSYFSGGMQYTAREGIDTLRNGCYVTVYDRRDGFLNHAKFIVSYIVNGRPFYRTVYRARYYGSTNFTLRGLAHDSNGFGNYEEYMVDLALKHPGCGDDLYFREMLNIIQHIRDNYTQPESVLRTIYYHIRRLRYMSAWGYKIATGTTLGELFTAYVNLLVANNRTYALLEDLPGRKLTQDLIRKLAEEIPPYNPFELEAISCDEKHAEHVASLLELDKEKLRSLVLELSEKKILKSIETLTSYASVIEKRGIKGLEPYFDEIEKSFMESLPVVETHISFLEKLRRGMQG